MRKRAAVILVCLLLTIVPAGIGICSDSTECNRLITEFSRWDVDVNALQDSDGLLRIVFPDPFSGYAVANPNVYDGNGVYPLHIAAKFGLNEIVRLLLLAGADINSTDGAGWAPLHYAANEGLQETLELLLKHEAEVNLSNQEGKTPYYYALIKTNIGIMQALTASGADTTAVGPQWKLLQIINAGHPAAGVVPGILSALLIHWFLWYLREKNMRTAAVLGAVCGAAIFAVACLFLTNPFAGQIHEGIFLGLGLLIILVTGIGLLHARKMSWSVYLAVPAVLMEAGAFLLLVSGAARLLDYLIVNFHLDGVFVVEGFFMRSLGIILLALTLLRPFSKAKAGFLVWLKGTKK